MITLDLFEQDPNFRKPVGYESTKHYGTVNFANLIKAYSTNPTRPVQFDFPGGKSYKLSEQWVDMLADYYNTLETQNDKAQLVYGVLTDYNKTIRFLNELAQSKLFEKKNSEKQSNPEFKNTKLARLKTQARAKYPSAGSDLEAMTADFVDSQDADQREFQRVKDTNKKQDELLKRITAINQQQDQEIDSLDSDKDELQQNLQQLRTVNAELAKKLADIAKRRPKEKEKASATDADADTTATAGTGTWTAPSAADTKPDWTAALPPAGIPTATPATVGGQPATVLAKPKRKRRSKAEIDAEKASKAAMSAMSKMAGGAKIKPVQPNIPPAPTVGKPSEIPAEIPKVIDLFPGASDTERTAEPASTDDVERADNVLDFPQRLQKVAEDEGRSIPSKMVVQGYTVEYDPVKRIVTVSRGGKLVGRAPNKPGSYNNYQVVANRIIDASEEDKYPDDLETRSVERPVGEALAAKNQYQLMQARKAIAQQQAQQAQPTEPQPAPSATLPVNEPITLAQAQSRRNKLDQILRLKQKIEQLTDRAQRKPGGIERGLAADLELDYPLPQTDQDYNDTLSYYQKLVDKLESYLARKKAVFSRRQHMEGQQAKDHSEAYVNGAREGHYARAKRNPYPAGTQEHRDWNRGYEAHYGDKEYTEESQLDRSGQPMYQQEPVYMLTHNGREVAFYKLKDLKRVEQDAQEMQKKLGGEVHIRKVMRETEQQPKDDDIMKQLFKDFGEIFGKPPAHFPQPKPQQPEKKEVKEGRAGYGPLLNQKHWEEVEQHLFKLLNDKTLDPETRAEVKQRWLDKQREAKLKGFKE